jgi:hypothetical protein
MKTLLSSLAVLAGGVLAAPALFAQTPTIDTVIADMTADNEAIPIKPVYNWQYKPQTVMHSPAASSVPTWFTYAKPDWCKSILSWYTAFEAGGAGGDEATGNQATNSRIQVRNLQVHVLSNATRQWTRVNHVAAPWTDLWKYPFAYAADMYSAAADVKTASTGGYTIKPNYPTFHHGYGTGYALPDPQDVRAVYAQIEFRLVVENPALPDDRANARYVVNVGADYWPGQGGYSWPYAPGIASGRYLLATNEWRTATMLVPNKDLGATYNEMRSNLPDPLKPTP